MYLNYDETITYKCEIFTNSTVDIRILQYVENGTDVVLDDTVTSDHNQVFTELTLPASVLFGNESTFELYCEVTTYTGYDPDPPQILNRIRFILNKTGKYAYCIPFDCTIYLQL